MKPAFRRPFGPFCVCVCVDICLSANDAHTYPQHSCDAHKIYPCLAALFANQAEFFDDKSLHMSRQQMYDRLAQIAERAGAPPLGATQWRVRHLLGLNSGECAAFWG